MRTININNTENTEILKTPGILMSSCLLGQNCTYRGDNNLVSQTLIKKLINFRIIPVCPEQLGGLSTPREPSEIQQLNNSTTSPLVLSSQGENVTAEFLKGAAETLKLAITFSCSFALLKERSPSCGVSEIYDGTFQHRIISGEGITSQFLRQNDITVYSENCIELLINTLESEIS